MNGVNGFQTQLLSMKDIDWDSLLDRPIAFHRSLVPITGSVNAALFLSQAIYWQRRVSIEGDGWWYKTKSKWTEETGLSPAEQENARKKLKKAGLLMEEKRGMPAKMWYRVHPAILNGLLLTLSSEETKPETCWPRISRSDTKIADCCPRIEDIEWAKVLSRPIAFHRRFVPVAGSINAALVLSQAFYWQHRVTDERGGWWYKTRSKWTEETGLSRNEQENARKLLSDAGILLEERLGMPAKIWYRLNPQVLRDRLTGVEVNRIPVDNQTHPNWQSVFEASIFNGTNQTSHPEGTVPPTDGQGISIALNSNSTGQTDHPEWTIPPADSPASSESSKPNSTRQTNQPARSWSVCSVQDGQFGWYLYKEKEIKTEITLPPQTPPPNGPDRGGGGGKTQSTAGEVIEPILEQSKSSESLSEAAKEISAGQGNRNWVFPDPLSDAERKGAQSILARYDCPDSTVQEILDVLAAIILAGEVRKSPLAVLRGLLERWQIGTFDATTGLHLAVARRRRAERQARIQVPMHGPPTVNDGPETLRKSPPRGVFDDLRKALKQNPQ